MSRTLTSPLFALAIVALLPVLPARAGPDAQASSGYTKVSSCGEVRTFCAEQCSKLSGGDAKNCVTPCQRDEADASDLNCGQVHHTPITSSCDEVLEFCAAKRCRLLKGIFRDACNAQCPVTVAEKNRLQCAFPADGAAKGVRYGPPPAAHCSEVASHCARQCAEMAPGDQANCSAMCPKIHAAMSHLACP